MLEARRGFSQRPLDNKRADLVQYSIQIRCNINQSMTFMLFQEYYMLTFGPVDMQVLLGSIRRVGADPPNQRTAPRLRAGGRPLPCESPTEICV